MFKTPGKLLKCFNILQNAARTKKSQDVPILINGKSVSVPSYYTVLQALKRERVVVPTFCYHERLTVAGNCRMCLIELEGWPKPQVACATPVMKGMKIRTNSPNVHKAQEGVLEFLLIDHPLDCPICDQGGECDLQDLSMRFGSDRSRFTDIHFEGKRAVENKHLSTLIRAEMTRCIHCTRCIRFASQVCGMDVLGSTGRGTDMLVGTYVEKMFLSELSGNIVDLCPVGALTSIPYMFKCRPWEVKRANSIDVTDATGTNIILNYRFDRVVRVLPREHDEINQEWLSDKGRWAIDSLNMQRLVTPMYRQSDHKLKATDWNTALIMTAEMLCKSCGNIMAIAGPHCNVETLVACKDLLNMLCSEMTYIERELDHMISAGDLRCTYSLNVNMKDVAKADKILLVGTNPRFEAPILNAWIRQAYINNECDIYVVGPKANYNYHVDYLGADVGALKLAKDYMSCAKKPLIFVGVSQLTSSNGPAIMSEVLKMGTSFAKNDWGVINIVTREASFAGALEAGWKPGAATALKTLNPTVIISLGADEIFYHCKPQNCNIIYIGFQGDCGASNASIVLPGCAYTESGGIYLNMEGRSQHALPAVTPPGHARHDWKIIRALAEYCGVCLFYSDRTSLCHRLAQISPNFVQLGDYQDKLFTELMPCLINSKSDNKIPVGGCIDVEMKKIEDYYCTDVFTHNSPTMVKATKAAANFATSHYASI